MPSRTHPRTLQIRGAREFARANATSWLTHPLFYRAHYLVHADLPEAPTVFALARTLVVTVARIVSADRHVTMIPWAIAGGRCGPEERHDGCAGRPCNVKGPGVSGDKELRGPGD